MAAMKHRRSLLLFLAISSLALSACTETTDLTDSQPKTAIDYDAWSGEYIDSYPTINWYGEVSTFNKPIGDLLGIESELTVACSSHGIGMKVTVPYTLPDGAVWIRDYTDFANISLWTNAVASTSEGTGVATPSEQQVAYLINALVNGRDLQADHQNGTASYSYESDGFGEAFEAACSRHPDYLSLTTQ